MKTSIHITQERSSKKQLFRQLVEVQISLEKYRGENSYTQNEELRNAILAIDLLFDRIIQDHLID